MFSHPDRICKEHGGGDTCIDSAEGRAHSNDAPPRRDFVEVEKDLAMTRFATTKAGHEWCRQRLVARVTEDGDPATTRRDECRLFAPPLTRLGEDASIVSHTFETGGPFARRDEVVAVFNLATRFPLAGPRGRDFETAVGAEGVPVVARLLEGRRVGHDAPRQIFG